MNIAYDARVLAKGRHSGIAEYTKLLFDHCFTIGTHDMHTVLYNSFSAVSLPEVWYRKKNVRVVRTRIPNKLLDLSYKLFHAPKVGGRGVYDIMVSPHFNLLYTKQPTKRIITFHDLSFLHFPEFYSWRKRYWHWMQAYAAQARRADHIVTVSEFTKHDLMVSFKIPQEKISVIYSGVNPLFQETVDEARFTKFRDTLPARYILSVGVLEPRKNIPALLRAFAYLKQDKKYKDVALVLVGERGWLYRHVEQMIAHSSYRQDIIRFGYASYEDLHFLYHGAEVFVYPSFFEGFGFPPLEAQACGTPVIASNRASLPEIVGKSALLIDPYRVHELVSALQALLESSSFRNVLCDEGFKNVQRFSWAKSAQKLLEICHTI